MIVGAPFTKFCGGVGDDILTGSLTYTLSTAVFSGSIANTYDNDTGTQLRWTGDLGQTKRYLEVDLLDPTKITEATYRSGVNDNQNSTKVELQYWNGSSWVVAGTFVDGTVANSTLWTVTLYPSPIKAQKWRFEITGPVEAYETISEIELKGCA